MLISRSLLENLWSAYFRFTSIAAARTILASGGGGNEMNFVSLFRLGEGGGVDEDVVGRKIGSNFLLASV